MLPSNWFENSTCKGCGYGERITGGVFCAMTQGLVPIGYQGCKAQNDFYEEQRKRENGMTLTELAHELRKIFRFKYLTVDSYGDEITLWMDKPLWDGDTWWAGDSGYLLDFYANRLDVSLDLSEYKDSDGNIDYSKCIVEVEE